MEFDMNTVIILAGMGGGLIAQAAYLKGTFTIRLDNHEKEIDRLDKDLENTKKNTRYVDTCEVISGSLDKRVCRLESEKNGVK